jgi:hypothetical protein
MASGGAEGLAGKKRKGDHEDDMPPARREPRRGLGGAGDYQGAAGDGGQSLRVPVVLDPAAATDHVPASILSAPRRAIQSICTYVFLVHSRNLLFNIGPFTPNFVL